MAVYRREYYQRNGQRVNFKLHQQHKQKTRIQFMKYAALREIANTSIRGMQPSYKTKTEYYLISSAILVLLGQAPNFDGRSWEVGPNRGLLFKGNDVIVT